MILLAALFGTLTAGAPAEPPCLPDEYLVLHRDSRDAALLVTATRDTVAAGWGDVPRPGYLAPERRHPIHGQVMDLSAVGGPAAGRVPTGRAVLVGWDLGYHCGPLPLAQSAAWLPEGSHAAVVARLRVPRAWVGGLPTFDVYRPDWVSASNVRSRWSVHSPEAPETLFQYYSLVPSRQAIAADPWGAVAPLRTWLDEHPEIASGVPIRSATRRVYEAVSHEAVTSSPAELAGTYRLEISRTGGPVQVAFLRTGPRPSRGLRAVDTMMVGIPHDPSGYHLPAALRLRPGNLPTGRPTPLTRLIRRLGVGENVHNAYLDVRLPAVEAPDGSRRFRGFLLTLNYSWAFRTDPELSRWDLDWYRMWRRDAVVKDPAEIVLWPDGRVEITQIARLDADLAITLRGERLSAVTVRE